MQTTDVLHLVLWSSVIVLYFLPYGTSFAYMLPLGATGAICSVVLIMFECVVPRKDPATKPQRDVKKRARRLASQRYMHFVQENQKEMLDLVRYYVSDIVPEEYLDAAVHDISTADHANGETTNTTQ